MLYYAYGSNMNWPQMKKRCPSAQFVGVARLIGHRLAFTRKSNRRGCGSADVIPAEGYAVWGVIYEIDEGEITNLDEAEDFVPGRAQNGYTRQQTLVYPPSQKTMGVSPWMNAQRGPSEARRAKEGASADCAEKMKDTTGVSPWRLHTDGKKNPVLVSLYFAEKQKNPPLPSADYKQLIVEGAKHWQLPQEYIEGLEQIKVAP